MMDLIQYRLILESSPNMIWRSNITMECDYFNKTWLAFTGRTMEEEYGFGWTKGVHPDDYDRCVKIYGDSFKQEKPFEMDYRLKRYDGEYRWINDRGIPFYNDENVFIGFLGSCMDITEKIEGQQMIEMAQNDFLCGTYNRQYSHLLLVALLKEAQEKTSALSVLMMDIDDFKNINDTYGHVAGDSVLTQVAGMAKNEIRNKDVIGRYGGDEFIIGLAHTSLEDAIVVAKRMSAAIENTKMTIPQAGEINVTVSIGIKSLEGEQYLDELIDKSDKKLYEAKKEGKNIVKW